MRVQENFPLSEYLWYKIGGRAKYFLEVSSLSDIPAVIAFLNSHETNRQFVCGLGSNLIFTDADFDGVVISFSSPDEREPLEISDGQLRVFAGDSLDRAIQFAFGHNLIGLEWAGGLPGTVGAGVRGNVGAFGGEIKDSLKEAEVLTLSAKKADTKSLANPDLQFSYRHSLIKENRDLVVLSATFALTHADDSALAQAKETYQKNTTYRQTNHPLNYPNCGSVFKNIKSPGEVEKVLSVWPEVREAVENKWHGKVSMGFIIRKLGLSGYTVGKAQVSEKHCNFIINLGEAKAVEVRQIINDIQDKCDETFGFRPEVEVEIVI